MCTVTVTNNHDFQVVSCLQLKMANRLSTGSVRQSDGNTLGRIHHFKLVLLGEESVGKSSLVLRFVKDQFRDALESTIGGKLKTVLFAGQCSE